MSLDPRADDALAEPPLVERRTKLSWIHVEAGVIGALVLLGLASMIAGWLDDARARIVGLRQPDARAARHRRAAGDRAERIGALALEGATGGVARWKAIAERYTQLFLAKGEPAGHC